MRIKIFKKSVLIVNRKRITHKNARFSLRNNSKQKERFVLAVFVVTVSCGGYIKEEGEEKNACLSLQGKSFLALLSTCRCRWFG